jgi:hypothetical protein
MLVVSNDMPRREKSGRSKIADRGQWVMKAENKKTEAPISADAGSDEK